MTEGTAQPRPDPQALREALFERAKAWWVGTLVARVVSFVLSGALVLSGAIPQLAPYLIAALALLAEGLQWRSDVIKGSAESLKRKLEYHNAFGWAITGYEMAQYLLQVPRKSIQRLPREGEGEPYFASTQGIGPTRALENVRESAWWSKNQAERLGHICFGITALAFLVALAILLFAVQAVDDPSARSGIGRIVTATITFVVSFGLIRLALGYAGFAKAAARVVESAEQALGAGGGEMIQAIKLLHDYQLARASAPLLPTWYYNRIRGHLNRLWDAYLNRAQA